MPQSCHSQLSHQLNKSQKRRPMSAHAHSAAPTRPSSSHRSLAKYNTQRNTGDMTIQGSAISLNATPNLSHTQRNNSASKYVSVRDLCQGNNTQLMKRTFNLENSDYIVPVHSYSKPKFAESREKKLDYISVFAEKVICEPGKLTKIFQKKKHTVPGPEVYDMTFNWSKPSVKDFENQKGKQYRNDRITSTEALIRSVKREKLPPPNLYKPLRQSRILGPANSKTHQLHMVANAQYYGKQTPGFGYKPQISLTKPRSTETKFYPRTKVEGGGPGLKGIKKDSDISPCFYKVNRNPTEKSTRQFKFGASKNKNFVEQYVTSRNYVPGVGKYLQIEKGLALQSRPQSSGPRRRIT